MLSGTVPDRVERLVLLEGLGPVSTRPEHSPERLACALQEQARKAGRPLSTYPSRAHVAELLKASPSNLAPASIDTLLKRGLRDVERGVQWSSDKRLRYASRVRFTEDQVLAFLRRIACPTLLVLATDGLRMPSEPSEPSEKRVEALANLTRVEVPGRHHVHLDDPDLVAPHVAAFLGAET